MQIFLFDFVLNTPKTSPKTYLRDNPIINTYRSLGEQLRFHGTVRPAPATRKTMQTSYDQRGEDITEHPQKTPFFLSPSLSLSISQLMWQVCDDYFFLWLNTQIYYLMDLQNLFLRYNFTDIRD